MTCTEEYATLWAFISSDKELTPSEKILYSIILSYSVKEGYSWATNSLLMERMGMGSGNLTRFKEHMVGLVDKGWIKIEGGTRDRKLYPLKNPIRAQNETQSNFVKKRIRSQNGGVIRAQNETQSPSPPIEDIIKETKENKIEGSGKPSPSSKMEQEKTQEKTKKSPFSQAVLMPEGYYKLPRMMAGHPQAPKDPKMARDVKDLLSNRIKIGSRMYTMAEEDKGWFFKFSPVVVEEAISRTNQHSKQGNYIRNPVAAIHACCEEIEREREKDNGPAFVAYYR